uniref:Uncharacterized protein n=1 Tax=viral metagenome TaxID=1070528 RepID=A0A6M3M346_9ZZZZ
MFNIVFKLKDGDLNFKTEVKNLARAAKLLGEENKVEVTVTEEVKPRPVKFKGVS